MKNRISEFIILTFLGVFLLSTFFVGMTVADADAPTHEAPGTGVSPTFTGLTTTGAMEVNLSDALKIYEKNIDGVPTSVVELFAPLVNFSGDVLPFISPVLFTGGVKVTDVLQIASNLVSDDSVPKKLEFLSSEGNGIQFRYDVSAASFSVYLASSNGQLAPLVSYDMGNNKLGLFQTPNPAATAQIQYGGTAWIEGAAISHLGIGEVNGLPEGNNVLFVAGDTSFGGDIKPNGASCPNETVLWKNAQGTWSCKALPTSLDLEAFGEGSFVANEIGSYYTLQSNSYALSLGGTASALSPACDDAGRGGQPGGVVISCGAKGYTYVKDSRTGIFNWVFTPEIFTMKALFSDLSTNKCTAVMKNTDGVDKLSYQVKSEALCFTPRVITD